MSQSWNTSANSSSSRNNDYIDYGYQQQLEQQNEKELQILSCLNGDDKTNRNNCTRMDDDETVDLWKLRELAISKGGLLSSRYRKVIWPKLIGIQEQVLTATSTLAASSNDNNNNNNNNITLKSPTGISSTSSGSLDSSSSGKPRCKNSHDNKELLKLIQKDIQYCFWNIHDEITQETKRQKQQQQQWQLLQFQKQQKGFESTTKSTTKSKGGDIPDISLSLSLVSSSSSSSSTTTSPSYTMFPYRGDTASYNSNNNACPLTPISSNSKKEYIKRKMNLDHYDSTPTVATSSPNTTTPDTLCTLVDSDKQLSPRNLLPDLSSNNSIDDKSNKDNEKDSEVELERCNEDRNNKDLGNEVANFSDNIGNAVDKKANTNANDGVKNDQENGKNQGSDSDNDNESDNYSYSYSDDDNSENWEPIIPKKKDEQLASIIFDTPVSLREQLVEEKTTYCDVATISTKNGEGAFSLSPKREVPTGQELTSEQTKGSAKHVVATATATATLHAAGSPSPKVCTSSCSAPTSPTTTSPTTTTTSSLHLRKQRNIPTNKLEQNILFNAISSLLKMEDSQQQLISNSDDSSSNNFYCNNNHYFDGLQDIVALTIINVESPSIALLILKRLSTYHFHNILHFGCNSIFGSTSSASSIASTPSRDEQEECRTKTSSLLAETPEGNKTGHSRRHSTGIPTRKTNNSEHSRRHSTGIPVSPSKMLRHQIYEHIDIKDFSTLRNAWEEIASENNNNHSPQENNNQESESFVRCHGDSHPKIATSTPDHNKHPIFELNQEEQEQQQHHHYIETLTKIVFIPLLAHVDPLLYLSFNKEKQDQDGTERNVTATVMNVDEQEEYSSNNYNSDTTNNNNTGNSAIIFDYNCCYTISWLASCWFTQKNVFQDFTIVSRLIDVFIASHPLMPMYVGVAMITYHRDDIEAFFDAIRAALPNDNNDINNSNINSEEKAIASTDKSSKAFINTDSIENIIEIAIAYMKRIPPKQLLNNLTKNTIPSSSLLNDDQSKIILTTMFHGNPPDWATTSVAYTDCALFERAAKLRQGQQQQNYEQLPSAVFVVDKAQHKVNNGIEKEYPLAYISSGGFNNDSGENRTTHGSKSLGDVDGSSFTNKGGKIQSVKVIFIYDNLLIIFYFLSIAVVLVVLNTSTTTNLSSKNTFTSWNNQSSLATNMFVLPQMQIKSFLNNMTVYDIDSEKYYHNLIEAMWMNNDIKINTSEASGTDTSTDAADMFRKTCLVEDEKIIKEELGVLLLEKTSTSGESFLNRRSNHSLTSASLEANTSDTVSYKITIPNDNIDINDEQDEEPDPQEVEQEPEPQEVEQEHREQEHQEQEHQEQRKQKLGSKLFKPLGNKVKNVWKILRERKANKKNKQQKIKSSKS